jgi:hypothetical protein
MDDIDIEKDKYNEVKDIGFDEKKRKLDYQKPRSFTDKTTEKKL